MSTQHDNRRQTFIPAAALKRFANDLERDGAPSNKFLQINRERVADFIGKNANDLANNQTGSGVGRKKKYVVAGVNDYSKAEEKQSFLHLQHTAEFQQGLGTRSRFGEGDGSFFDQWLNADVMKSKHIVDKDGLPLMRFCLTQTQTGFKKQMNDHKAGNKSGNIHYVKTYAQRREERLAAEKQTATESVTTNTALPDLPPPTSRTEHDTMSSYVNTRASTAVDFKLPSIEAALSATDRDNYFGEQARSTFFEYYRQLARQRYTIGGAKGSAQEGNEEEDLGSLRSARYDDEVDTNAQNLYEQEVNTYQSETPSKQKSLVEPIYAKKPLLVANEDDDAMQYSPRHDYQTDTAAASGSRPGSRNHNTGFRHLSMNTHNNGRNNRNMTNTNEEKKLLWKHLSQQPPSRPATAATSPRPLSARSKFLLGCVKKDLPPQPGILIRKEITTILNIASMGIANEVAALLSESLETLPLLEGLCIDDNNLTDPGLVPIVNKLIRCRYLKSFDLSNNKVDALTADALQIYLSSESCNLQQLIMRNANVDDNEASRFMLAIAVRNTIQELDLSQNLLGSHEFAIRKEEHTAGESIARLLEDPVCSIKSLKLSWNMIRYQSGVSLMKSLSVNKTLTYLDVSYNGLGVDGGESLGDALHTNKSLEYLNISHNNITARACFTILSGVRSCMSLTEVDLSENPIGEEGARSLLALNMTDGHRVLTSIKGCSLRINDKTCWFDSHNDAEKEYTLQLNKPYDRAVCIELLRLVAQNEGLTVEKFLYQSPEDTTPTELNLAVNAIATAANTEATNTTQNSPRSNANGRITHSNTQHSTFDEDPYSPSNIRTYAENSSLVPPLTAPVDSQHAIYEIASDIDTARDLFQKTANRIFKQYDTDESGSLDKDELYDVLKQLGMKGSRALVDRLLSIYDTDNSGRVEEEEFVNFLTDMKVSYERTQSFGNERRYLYSTTLAESNPSIEHIEYFPPSIGKVTVKVTGQRTLPDFVQTISHESVETMLNNAKLLQDSGTLFECALTVMKLNFNEAKTFYRVMLKDTGNEQQVLLRLLPRMSSCTDARLLISYVTNNDFLRTHHLKVLLGNLYRIYIGIPNGFYRLNLAEERDLYVMQRLVELSNTYARNRQLAGLGDTSQHGNWSGFRNSVLDGKACILTPLWLDNLPDKGRVEFDFVSFEQVSMNESTISHLRLFRLLCSIGLVAEDKRKRVFIRLKFNTNEGRAASKGSGVRKWEVPTKTAEIISNKLHKLYGDITSNRKGIEDSNISTEEMAFVEMKRNGTKHPSASSQANPPSTELSPPTSPSSPHKLGSPDMRDGSMLNMFESSMNLNDMNDGDRGAIETFDTHIKFMIDSGMADYNMVAARTLDVLESALAGRNLSCVQLALIVSKFPEGSELHNDYTTYRVELIVRLFNRLVDIINFDYVLKELEQPEHAMLVFRLGWLNIWNPLKAEGAIQLDLSRREEKQIVRMLIILNYVEGSKHSWMEPLYRPPGVVTLPDEPWKLPNTWFSEQTLPNNGILSLTYFSGRGVGLLECNPDVSVRTLLMAHVLAQPHEEDTAVFGIPSVFLMEEKCEELGCKLTFITVDKPVVRKGGHKG